MPQQQRIVEIELNNGEKSKAIATGSNAAWICKCRRKVPLLGRTGLVDRLADEFRVDCPDCKSSYYVIPDGNDQGAVLKIVEV